MLESKANKDLIQTKNKTIASTNFEKKRQEQML